MDYRLSLIANNYLPNSELKLLSNVGHGCIFEYPNKIADHISKFPEKCNSIPLKLSSKKSQLCPTHKLEKNKCPYPSSYFKKCLIEKKNNRYNSIWCRYSIQ